MQDLPYVVTTEALEPMEALDLLCKQISCADDRIDLVAILNRKGRVVEMIARHDGISNDLTSHKREMMFMEFVLQASMNSEYDDEFGKVNGFIIQREKVFAFSFLVYDLVLVVMTKPLHEPTVMQEKISRVIENHLDPKNWKPVCCL